MENQIDETLSANHLYEESDTKKHGRTTEHYWNTELDTL